MAKRWDLGGFEKYLTDLNIFIFLFVFSLAIRIVFANAGIPHFDSIADAKNIPTLVSTGNLTYLYSYGYGAPGIIVLLAITYFFDHLIRGAANAEFAYFFVTFITAALSTSVLYLVAKKITKNRFIGFASALFFCVTPIYLSVTTYPKTHAPGEFFALLAGYLLLRAADFGNEPGKSGKEMGYIILSGLLFSFAISIRIFSLFYLVPFVLLYAAPALKTGKSGGISITFNRRILDWKNIIAFAFSLFIVAFVLFMPRFMDIGFGGFINLLLGERHTITASMNPSFLERIISALLGLHFSVTWLGWIAILLGIFYFFRKNRLALSALAAWFLLFFGFFSNINAEPRFFTSALIVLMILMAAGCYIIYQNSRLIGIALVLLLVIIMFMKIYPIIEARHLYSGQKEFALWIGSVTEPNSMLVSNDEGFFYTFYTGRPFAGHYYSGTGQDITNFMAQMKNYSAHGIPTYIDDAGVGYDPDGSFRKALAENFDIYLIGSKANEGYGMNTLQFQKYDERLYKLVPKQPGSSGNQSISR